MIKTKITSAEIRRKRINRYIYQLKQIKIKSIIYNLSSSDLRRLIELAKTEQIQNKDKLFQYLSFNQQVIQRMIHIQLNEIIGKLTNMEKVFLRSQDIKVGTYRTQITEYRKAIKELLANDYKELEARYRIIYEKLKHKITRQLLTAKELDIALKNIKNNDQLTKIRDDMSRVQENNPVSRAAQIALYKMTVGRETQEYIEKQYEKIKHKRQEEYKLINPAKYIKIAEELLKSTDHHELILGICALTGRRQIEVIKTGKFEIYNDYSMVFTGQAKKRGVDMTSYIIPVLCLPQKVTKAIKTLKSALKRKGIDYENDSNTSINNRLFTSPKSSQLKRKIFESIYPTNLSDLSDKKGGLSYKKLDLRSAYAAICYNVFDPDMSFRAYIAKILNHADMNSAASYDQYKTYGNK